MSVGRDTPLARAGLLEPVDVEVHVGVQLREVRVVELDPLVVRHVEPVPRPVLVGEEVIL